MSDNGLYDLPCEGLFSHSVSTTYKGGEPVYTAEPVIQVVRDNPNQFKKAHSDDAGYDIIAAESGEIPGNSSELIDTNLYVSIPKGYVGIIKSRSGLSVKHGIDVGAGVIDSGYRGEIKVLLRNTFTKWFDYAKGDKIAQMIVVPVFQGLVKEVDSLNSTTRGENGFNSTGR